MADSVLLRFHCPAGQGDLPFNVRCTAVPARGDYLTSDNGTEYIVTAVRWSLNGHNLMSATVVLDKVKP